MVSGAAPSKAKTLQKDLLPVSGLLSTSGRGYNDPEVGWVPITDFFSDSLVSWLRRMSSLVMVFFVFLSTTSLASARGPFPPWDSQRTLPAREEANLGVQLTDELAMLHFLSWVWRGNAGRPPALELVTACDIIRAAMILYSASESRRDTWSQLGIGEGDFAVCGDQSRIGVEYWGEFDRGMNCYVHCLGWVEGEEAVSL